MCYPVQPRYQIFVKGYGFLFFAKNMSNNIGKNISKSVSGKYSQKLLHHAKTRITPILKLNFKLQYLSKVYAIIIIHKHL